MAQVWIQGATMARPKKSAAIDLSVTHELSHGLIERLSCPDGQLKAFLRDKDVTGLRVRVTANGAKAFVYEAKLNGKAISKTLGKFPIMSIDEAKDAARLLAKTVKTDKADPRELARQQQAAKDAQTAAIAATQIAQALTVKDAWDVYVLERKPHWGDRHYADHLKMAGAGGKPAKRGTSGRKVTIAGPIYPLLSHRLIALTPATIEAWAATEAITRPTYGRLAWRCLKAFLGWCSEQEAYKHLIQTNPAKTKKTREAFGKPAVKQDVLQKGQLAAWFDAVRNMGDPVTSAYLQTLLLLGARPGEVLTLEWSDVDVKWKSITIRDKVEGERMVPLTSYVHSLIATLPRRKMRDGKTANPWIFSSPSATDGVLTIPRNAHIRACKVAGIDGLSLHGLRRSFKSLTEWIEVPTGIVAQIMGHKPSATAEKHYTVRPLELLALHHEKIEAWILEQAGIPFDAKAAPGALRAVA